MLYMVFCYLNYSDGDYRLLFRALNLLSRKIKVRNIFYFWHFKLICSNKLLSYFCIDLFI